MRKKIIWGIVIIVVIGGSIAAWYAYNEFDRKPETAADKETDMRVDANQIMKEFTESEEKASEKYSEKTIEITGTVFEIESDESDNLSVSLETTFEDEMGLPACVRVTLLPEMEEKIGTLHEGDKVILKGLYKGILEGNIIFNLGIIL